MIRLIRKKYPVDENDYKKIAFMIRKDFDMNITTEDVYNYYNPSIIEEHDAKLISNNMGIIY